MGFSDSLGSRGFGQEVMQVSYAVTANRGLMTTTALPNLTAQSVVPGASTLTTTVTYI